MKALVINPIDMSDQKWNVVQSFGYVLILHTYALAIKVII